MAKAVQLNTIENLDYSQYQNEQRYSMLGELNNYKLIK